MEKNYTDKELELVFEKILKMYKSSYSPKEKPKVFLLGGQPGAGKTRFIHFQYLFKYKF